MIIESLTILKYQAGFKLLAASIKLNQLADR